MINYWKGRGASNGTIMLGMADGWAGGCDSDDYGYSQEVAVEKTQYAIDNGFSGVWLFRTDLDTMNPATSLLQAIRDTVVYPYCSNICEPRSVYDLDGDKKVGIGDFAMIAGGWLEPGGIDFGDVIGFAGDWLFDLGLVGYWKFDESSGDTAADSAYCSQNGTVENMNNGDWVAKKVF